MITPKQYTHVSSLLLAMVITVLTFCIIPSQYCHVHSKNIIGTVMDMGLKMSLGSGINLGRDSGIGLVMRKGQDSDVVKLR